MHSFWVLPLWVSVRKTLQSDAVLELMMCQHRRASCPHSHLLVLISELSESLKLAEPTWDTLVSAEGALKPPPGDPRCCFCCCFEAPNTEFSEQFPGIPPGLARATAEERRCFTIFTLRYCSRYFRRGGGRGGSSEAVKLVMTGAVKADVNAGILHKSTQTKERFSF